MAILDGHIHAEGSRYDCANLQERMRAVGIGGAVVLSSPPKGTGDYEAPDDPFERLDDVLRATSDDVNLFPFFWIDPTEPGAIEQVQRAASGGINGFKIICSNFAPGDRRAMDTYRAIAESGEPILFHSGILWDGADSSRFNRPAGFESLLAIPALRFSLAHIGWPWCDELIAVYGKFLASRSARGDAVPEMFVDTTPGTPVIYRRPALEKLYTIGYDIERNVIFGTDCVTTNYNQTWAREWIDRDTSILVDLGVDEPDRNAYFGGNLKRFLGLPDADTGSRDIRPLRQAE